MTTTPPHEYVPDGPVKTAPYLGFRPPEVRQEAFAAVLEGVELGAYDMRMVSWSVEVGDDPTCRTIASLMWRCRLAEREEGRQRTRIGWSAFVRQAGEIAGSYDAPVTLRQLFHRLVSAQVILNTQCAYKRLSELTPRRGARAPFRR